MKDGRRTHLANIKARRLEATTATLTMLALKNPLSTIGVTFAIHWQALLLWMRGAKYHSRPALPGRQATLAQEPLPFTTTRPDSSR